MAGARDAERERTSDGAPPRSVARALATMTVLDERTRSVCLGDLWRVEPVVLAFVRHFG
jgi:hypothetical protein